MKSFLYLERKAEECWISLKDIEAFKQIFKSTKHEFRTKSSYSFTGVNTKKAIKNIEKFADNLVIQTSEQLG